MRRKREKKQTMDLDITSLLDVLVILLVFLLKSYNASDLTVNLQKGIDLPKSNEKKLGEFAVVVQVSRDGAIWVDNRKLEPHNAFESANIDDEGKLVSLYKELITKFEENKEERKEKDPNKMVNLVMDQELEFAQLRRVMHTAGLVGHGKFNFIVKGDF